MTEQKKKGILLVISGFAGTGKGTVVKKILEKDSNFGLSVSMTTRSPRPGEQEGISYFFTEREKFEETIRNNGLIEYAEYCGNYYGTPRAYVEQQLEQGRNVILEIEIQGARKVKELYPDSLLVFVAPPSAAELEKRLRGRGTETDEVVKKRLSRAWEESQGMEEYDFIVINDQVEACAEQVIRIAEAAQGQPIRMQAFAADIRQQLEQYKI